MKVARHSAPPPLTYPGNVKASRGILTTLFVIVFIDLVGFGMVVTLMPRYGELYQPTPLVLGLLMATFSFFQFLGAPVLGRLSDRYGRRPVLLLSLLGAAFGYVLLAIAQSMAVLFLARAVAGAMAGNISTAHAVIADVTGPESRARGMGIVGAAFGLGFIVGPAVGGVLFVHSPWLPGGAAAATSLAAFAMTFLLLPETHTQHGKAGGDRAMINWRSLKAALAHQQLRLCLIGFFLLIFGFANYETSFVLYCEQRFAMDARATGYLFFFVGLVIVIVQGGLIGRLTSRFGEPLLVVIGAMVSVIAFVLLPFIPDPRLFLGLLAFLAFGTAIVSPSLSSLTSRLVDPEEVGGVMGIYQAMGSLGRIGGPVVGVLLFKDLGPAWPFIMAALVTLAAFGLAVVLRSRLAGHHAVSKPTAG